MRCGIPSFCRLVRENVLKLEQPVVQSVIVMNAKGGCGKTTVATNLASYLAAQGRATALFDFDPQGSSSRWQRERRH